jgi:surface antigen
MFRLGILPAIMLLTAFAAPAQNINFLSRGPVALMTAEEKGDLRAAFDAALDDAADGDTVEWKSADSDHKSKIKLVNTHQDFGTTCRTIRTMTSAGGRTGGGTYRLCLDHDDTWQFAPNRKSDLTD